MQEMLTRRDSGRWTQGFRLSVKSRSYIQGEEKEEEDVGIAYVLNGQILTLLLDSKRTRVLSWQ